MPYFVYILKSEVDGDYYKGSSENPHLRLKQHNNGEADFTSTKMLWKLVFLEMFDLKRDALVREKQIKRWNRTSIENLIKSSANLFNQPFFDFGSFEKNYLGESM